MSMWVDKIWARRGPPEDQSLRGLFADFRRGRDEDGVMIDDPVIAYTAEQDAWKDAVRVACDSRYPRDGRMVMWYHQTKVRQSSRDEFARAILDSNAEEAETFHDFYEQLKELRPWGIGIVTVYDVAIRLAAWLQLPILRVYTHAGVKEGLEALGVLVKGRESFPVEELPEALAALVEDGTALPEELEDFLCAYRHHLSPEILP